VPFGDRAAATNLPLRFTRRDWIYATGESGYVARGCRLARVSRSFRDGRDPPMKSPGAARSSIRRRLVKFAQNEIWVIPDFRRSGARIAEK